MEWFERGLIVKQRQLVFQNVNDNWNIFKGYGTFFYITIDEDKYMKTTSNIP